MKKIKDSYLEFCKFGLGIILVIVGIVFLFKSQDSHTYSRDSEFTRADTSIKFGADYYTTSAQNSALTANGVSDLYAMVTFGIGTFFIFIGGIDICLVIPNLEKSKSKVKK